MGWEREKLGGEEKPIAMAIVQELRRKIRNWGGKETRVQQPFLR